MSSSRDIIDGDREAWLGLNVSTYFIAGLEALSFDSRVRIRSHSDTGLLLRSKNVINLANQLLVLSPDHSGK